MWTQFSLSHFPVVVICAYSISRPVVQELFCSLLWMSLVGMQSWYQRFSGDSGCQIWCLWIPLISCQVEKMTGCPAHGVTPCLVGNVQAVILSRPFVGAQQRLAQRICGTLRRASRCCTLAVWEETKSFETNEYFGTQRCEDSSCKAALTIQLPKENKTTQRTAPCAAESACMKCEQLVIMSLFFGAMVSYSFRPAGCCNILIVALSN